MRALWLFIPLVVGSIQGARIAGIYPTPSISHQLPFQAVMRALALRGHDVTVISPDPLKVPHPNYTDVDLSFSYDFWKDYDFAAMEDMSPYSTMDMFTTAGVELCKMQLSSKVMQDFMKTNPKFDLVFIEDLMFQSYFGLVHHFGSPPMIGLLSLGVLTSSLDAMGNPNNPSYEPDFLFPYSDHMTFWERANNMLYGLWVRYNFYWKMIPVQEKLMREFFGLAPPPIIETANNFSLFMVNMRFTMSYPRPLLPSIIELGNLHLQQKTRPLPKDLKQFLDDAKEGFIYFSLGSNVRSDKLPEHQRQQLLEAFAELPLRVLWKWESDTLPGQPDNVMLGKWLPQQDVLAHPNIRLFVTQGGLQSLNEAVNNAVPMVGIPFIGDQKYNVAKLVAAGVGLKIDFKSLTKEIVINTFNTVLNDPSYRENVKKLSAINMDQPETPLERAVWWTEYVLRHNGAKHMRSASLDLAWYQYLLLDVIGFIVLSLLVVITIVFLVLRQCVRMCRSSSNSKSKSD